MPQIFQVCSCAGQNYRTIPMIFGIYLHRHLFIVPVGTLSQNLRLNSRIKYGCNMGDKKFYTILELRLLNKKLPSDCSSLPNSCSDLMFYGSR